MEMDVPYDKLGSILTVNPYAAYSARRRHGAIVKSKARGGWDVVGFRAAYAALRDRNFHVLQGLSIADLQSECEESTFSGIITFQQCYLAESNSPKQKQLRRPLSHLMSAQLSSETAVEANKTFESAIDHCMA